MLDKPRYSRTHRHADERFYKHKGPLLQTVEDDIFRHGTPLNVNQEMDTERMWVQIPELVAGNNATKGWAFCHPPILHWPRSKGGGKGGKGKGKREIKLDEEGEYIVENYYGPFRWECYIRGMKKYGIVCWKYKEIGDYRVPVVPPVGSGTIYQRYEPEEMKYHYRWMWKGKPDLGFDLEMCFYVWYPPAENGDFTSPAMSILQDWKMAQHVSLTTQRITHQTSRLPVFMVHHPPKGRPGDKKIEVPFGDAEDLEYEREQHNRQLEKATMSQNANRAAVEHSRALNQGYAGAENLLTTGGVYGHKPLLNSESLADIQKREGDTILDRLVYLDDHWEPVPATAPPILADSLAYSSRLGMNAALVVDFPLIGMLDKQGQHKGNFDSQLTFAKERMKETSASLSRMLKTVFLDAQADMLKKMYMAAVKDEITTRNKPMTEEEMMEINMEFKDFAIEQICTPLITWADATEMFEMGVLTHKSYVEQAGHLMGVADHYIEEATKEKPLMRKREMEMKQLELAEKQFTLSKDTAKKQQELAEDQFSLAKEQAHNEEAAPTAAKKKKSDK